jgi:hypothetical protein
MSLLTYIDRFVPPLSAAWRVWLAQSQDGFIKAVEKLLEESIDHLEKNAKNYGKLGETGLSAVVVAYVNRFGIRADNEPNSNGHVDIHIENAFRRALSVCGEAKVYDGPVYHVIGLGQVLDYATGRCRFGFVIEYVKSSGTAAGAADEIEKHMNTVLPERQKGNAVKHAEIELALTTTHGHRRGHDLHILHLIANLKPPAGRIAARGK